MKAVADFVAKENRIAQKRSSRYAYRLWAAGDAGEAIYRGLRTIDGHRRAASATGSGSAGQAGKPR